MPTTVRVAKITLAYEDATSRTYNFTGIERPLLIKDKVLALNASLEAGTANAFANTFVSNSGAKCKMVSKTQIVETIQEKIYPDGEDPEDDADDADDAE